MTSQAAALCTVLPLHSTFLGEDFQFFKIICLLLSHHVALHLHLSLLLKQLCPSPVKKPFKTLYRMETNDYNEEKEQEASL